MALLVTYVPLSNCVLIPGCNFDPSIWFSIKLNLYNATGRPEIVSLNVWMGEGRTGFAVATTRRHM